MDFFFFAPNQITDSELPKMSHSPVNQL